MHPFFADVISDAIGNITALLPQLGHLAVAALAVVLIFEGFRLAHRLLNEAASGSGANYDSAEYFDDRFNVNLSLASDPSSDPRGNDFDIGDNTSTVNDWEMAVAYANGADPEEFDPDFVSEPMRAMTFDEMIENNPDLYFVGGDHGDGGLGSESPFAWARQS